MIPPLWLLRIFSALHVFIYRLSGGRLGAMMNGLPVLLLTTTGRKSGRPRTLPLVYMRDEADYIIAPGVLERPAWYLNLRAHPQATIQIGTSAIQVNAQEAHGDERRRLWAQAPAYWHDYQKRAKAELPVIILQATSRLSTEPDQSN